MHKRLPLILRNKYFLALLVVLVWLIFFDNHNLIQQWRLQRQINELRQEKAFYIEEIAQDSVLIKQLKNDPEALRRLARERFLMKKQGEDVYIITPDQH